jgi:TPR repeat protein
VGACTSLGQFYRQGNGVPQDNTEAARWFRLAADQGEATAQGNLGALYHAGIGVPQDNAEAARWFRLAADQGHPNALAAIADLGL